MHIFRQFPLTLFCVALIWYLCLFKPPRSPFDTVEGFDKIVHVLMYLGTCSVFWAERYWHRVRLSKWALFGWGVLFPILMSGLVELCQEHLTTCRSGDWYDFAANSFGVCLACLLHFLWQKYRSRRDL